MLSSNLVLEVARLDFGVVEGVLGAQRDAADALRGAKQRTSQTSQISLQGQVALASPPPDAEWSGSSLRNNRESNRSTIRVKPSFNGQKHDELCSRLLVEAVRRLTECVLRRFGEVAVREVVADVEILQQVLQWQRMTTT